MKYTLGILIISLSIVFISCNATKSETQQQLIAENNKLKDSLIQYKQILSKNTEAIIELEKMNIVYRGIDNPMKIIVPNAISVSVIAPGLKNKGNGNFVLRPTIGKKVTIRIIAEIQNGEKVEFKKVFRIHEIGSGKVAVNNVKYQSDFIKLTKNDIKYSYFSLYISNYLPYEMEKAKSFSVLFPKRNKVSINGNTFSEEAQKTLDQMQIGDTIYITNVKKLKYIGVRICKISPLGIEITEE